MDQIKIGRFIANLRKEKNMTQEQLGEKIGVSFKTISKWENGRGMPELSTLKPLSDELGITINELLSGEKIEKENYQEKLEENFINTIDYTNQKIEIKNNLIALIFIIFGVLIAITAVAIFPSESSWGSIYSIFGVIISLIGFSKFTKKLTLLKRVISNFAYFIIFISILMIIDYIGVVNIHQAPRFSISKISSDNIIYYDTLFYDVIRYNVDKDNESFVVIKNQKYDRDFIDEYIK